MALVELLGFRENPFPKFFKICLDIVRLCFFLSMLTLPLKDFHTPGWPYLVEYALLRQGEFGGDLEHSMVPGVLPYGGER